jgi:hypothetical protein
MSTPNALSFLGRMTYGQHLIAYPSLVLFYSFVVAPWRKRSAENSKKQEYDMIPKAKTVDPALFSPFSPIPYHNNYE